MLDAPRWQRWSMPDPVIPPDWGSAGVAGVVAAVAAGIGMLGRDFFGFLSRRGELKDQASFRHDLVRSVQGLEKQVGGLQAQVSTYEAQVDALETRVLDLTAANRRILEEFETAGKEAARLLTRVKVLTARVVQLTNILIYHGIPVPDETAEE